MKNLKILTIGILFGITLTKSEVISWYRIYEMFRFESFHMYGVIGSAIILGIISMQLIKYFDLKDFQGNSIDLPVRGKRKLKPLLGGTAFGIGWAFTGACPGPIYIIIGNGYLVFIVVLISAVIGTFCYGLLRDHLPQW